MKYLTIVLVVLFPSICIAQTFSPPDSIWLVFDGNYELPLAYPNAKHITDVILGSYYFPAVVAQTGDSLSTQCLFSYWDDLFKYWSYPDSCSSSQGLEVGNGNIATDSYGNLHFAWHRAGNSDGYEIFYTKAFLDTSAGIITYNVERPPVMVSQTDGGADAFPAMCLYNDSAYIVWNHGVIGEETAIFSNTPAETAYADPISGGFLLNSIAPDPLTGDLWVASTFDINGDSLIDIVALHYDKSSGTWSNEVAAYGNNSHDFICGGITINYNGIPGIVFLSSTVSSFKNRFIVDPYGSLLFTRKVGGNWTDPDTIEPTSSPALNDYIGWPSVGIAENNDIYIAFTQPVSLKKKHRYGIGPVYYTKIVPDSNIYNIERVLVSSDSVYCYHPHIVYNVPLPVLPPGPDIIWCEGSGSVYFRHMPLLPAGIEERKKNEIAPLMLLKVSPNPFTNSTTITFAFPSAQGHKSTGVQERDTELNIYDVSGRLVKSVPLTTNHLSLGTDLKGGIYFLKLKVKGEKVNLEKIKKVAKIR